MLHSAKESNKKIMELKQAWRVKRLEKLKCKKCPYKTEQPKHCHLCSYTITSRDTVEEKTEMQYDCEECGQEWRQRMQDD